MGHYPKSVQEFVQELERKNKRKAYYADLHKKTRSRDYKERCYAYNKLSELYRRKAEFIQMINEMNEDTYRWEQEARITGELPF